MTDGKFSVDFGWFKHSDKIEIDKVSGVEVRPEKVVIHGKSEDGEQVSYERTPSELKYLVINTDDGQFR